MTLKTDYAMCFATGFFIFLRLFFIGFCHQQPNLFENVSATTILCPMVAVVLRFCCEQWL